MKLLELEPIRCQRKRDCFIAWPEDCPAWDRWECPVDEGQRPQTTTGEAEA